MSGLEPARLAEQFAAALSAADARSPVALNARTKVPYQPGIGPHPESSAVRLMVEELTALDPEVYTGSGLGVAYPEAPRQKCDWCIGPRADGWAWAIEVKLLRFLGDNGGPNDNMLMHVLSPYPQHRSAVTDCDKLRSAALGDRSAVLIYGFDSADWPLTPAIDAFEIVARSRGPVGPRHEAQFSGLVHPVHRSGSVFVWEVLPPVLQG